MQVFMTHQGSTKLISGQFRLLLAGIYPVEFRDFFLGDMYCSQTYAMGVSITTCPISTL